MVVVVVFVVLFEVVVVVVADVSWKLLEWRYRDGSPWETYHDDSKGTERY
jgi:hypothetical protein